MPDQKLLLVARYVWTRENVFDYTQLRNGSLQKPR